MINSYIVFEVIAERFVHCSRFTHQLRILLFVSTIEYHSVSHIYHKSCTFIYKYTGSRYLLELRNHNDKYIIGFITVNIRLYHSDNDHIGKSPICDQVLEFILSQSIDLLVRVCYIYNHGYIHH